MVTAAMNRNRRLHLGRKAMTNLDSILKSTDITLLTKVHIVKAMVFPVVMYRCESWAIKKSEHWGIKAFELWCWRRHLRVGPLDSKIKPVKPKGNQPWIFIGRTDAEAPILWPPNAKSLTHWKRPWCWERLRAGGEGDDRGWHEWHHQLNGHEFKQTLGDSEGQGSLACCSPQGRRVWQDWVTEQQNQQDLIYSSVNDILIRIF